MRPRTAISALVSAALTAALGPFAIHGPTARANEGELAALEAESERLVERIDAAAATYACATKDVDELVRQMDEATAHLAQVEEALPAQRERTAQSVKSMYLFQQSSPSLLGLILTSESFNDFITTIQYLDAVHDHNTRQILALTTLADDISQTKAALTAELDQALVRQRDSLVALEDVRAARQELDEKANELRAAARAASDAEQARAEELAQATEEQAQEAIAVLDERAQAATEPVPEPAAADETTGAPEDEAKPTPGTPERKTSAPSAQTPEPPASEPAVVDETPPEATTTEEDVQEAPAAAAVAPTVNADTSSWAARIDAYLEGSPLAGYGQAFADAAAAYGVDPRVSPAISCIESSKGAVCFASHNAWGWGSSGWSSWEEAINAHVSGFASVYGSSVDLAGAKLYAGDDIYLTWYNLVLEEMASI